MKSRTVPSTAAEGLRRLVAFREGMHSPCWMMRTHDNCALIVPTLHVRLEFLRTFKRFTVDEAVRLGLVELGAVRQDVPPFAYCPPWLRDTGTLPDGRMALQGRTITAPRDNKPINSSAGETA